MFNVYILKAYILNTLETWIFFLSFKLESRARKNSGFWAKKRRQANTGLRLKGKRDL